MPPDNPIIVHVGGPEDLGALADDVPAEAARLMGQFWPGPLTLILRKSGQLPPEVTGGQDTVAVRMPRNTVALALVRALGRPIAAPSANLSGRPSPTTAGHVLHDLGGRIDIILDGGPVEVGIESTVLDLSQHPPVILRPGAVTREDLKPFIGEYGGLRGEKGRCGNRRARAIGTIAPGHGSPWWKTRTGRKWSASQHPV